MFIFSLLPAFVSLLFPDSSVLTICNKNSFTASNSPVSVPFRGFFFLIMPSAAFPPASSQFPSPSGDSFFNTYSLFQPKLNRHVSVPFRGFFFLISHLCRFGSSAVLKVSVPFRGFFFLILSPTPRHLCLSQTAFAWEIFFSPCSGPRTLQKTLPFRCLQGARENARLPGYPVTGLMS